MQTGAIHGFFFLLSELKIKGCLSIYKHVFQGNLGEKFVICFRETSENRILLKKKPIKLRTKVLWQSKGYLHLSALGRCGD